MYTFDLLKYTGAYEPELIRHFGTQLAKSKQSFRDPYVKTHDV